MTELLTEWWVHTVGVRRLIGSGGDGDVYLPAEPADPASVLGFYRDETKLVIGPNGDQVNSAGQFAFARSIDPIPVGSRVTVPDWAGGRTTTVVKSSVGDGGGQPTPDHQEIAVL